MITFNIREKTRQIARGDGFCAQLLKYATLSESKQLKWKPIFQQPLTLTGSYFQLFLPFFCVPPFDTLPLTLHPLHVTCCLALPHVSTFVFSHCSPPSLPLSSLSNSTHPSIFHLTEASVPKGGGGGGGGPPARCRLRKPFSYLLTVPLRVTCCAFIPACLPPSRLLQVLN